MAGKGFGKGGGPLVPDEVREKYRCLREDIIKMEAAANEAEKNGDDSGAKFKMMLLGDMNEKIKELEQQHPGLLAPAPAPSLPTIVLAQQQAQMQNQQFLAMHMQQPMTFTQQQALLYDQAKLVNGEMDNDVKEFQEKYGLQDRHAFLLNDTLKTRNDSFEDDLWAMDEIMSKCNNGAQRADLLNMNVRWMVEGKFCGAYSPNPAVQKAAKKFNLDPPAACKLAHQLEERDDPDGDMDRINKHLERSNKPSSLVMMFLKTLKAGGQIDDHYKPVAVGSWLHKQEQSSNHADRDARQKNREKKSRSRADRRRSRSRGADNRGRGRRGDSRGRGVRDDGRGRGGQDSRGPGSSGRQRGRNDSRERQAGSRQGGGQ